ncbi:hypothetical protein ABZ769_28275 [Streptomyces olivoreticuli]
MTAVALYTVALWGVTAWAARRCWTKWRHGADRLWAERWNALSVTLLVLMLPVIGTLGLSGIAPLINAAATGSLLLASGACHVAKSVATRRADTATRAMRTSLGLPVARRLMRTTTVAALWFAGAFLSLLGWLAAAAVRNAAHHQQLTGEDRRAALDQTVSHAMAAAFVVLVLGTLHCVIQQIRHDRERRRVRAAEQYYLAPED